MNKCNVWRRAASIRTTPFQPIGSNPNPPPLQRRHYARFSTKPPPPPPPPSSTARPPPPNTHPPPPPTARTRIHRIQARLPRFLQPYTQPLLSAPLTTISAFLLLHELTAIIPLVGLAAFFHYSQWLPPWLSEGKWAAEGVEKFGRYFRRKGWLGAEEVEGGDVTGGGAKRKKESRRGKWWGRGEGGVRILVEVATAWAVTKALLPLRLAVSLWATPWFARVGVVPVVGWVGRVVLRRGRGRGKGGGGAGGDGVG